MSITKTLATSRRVLTQIKHDPRTLVIVLIMPCILMTILKYVFYNQPKMFNSLAPMILGIFPLFMMFLITSVATLRERTSGTLDRLLTEPISKLDFVFGYAIAFCSLAFLQAIIVSLVTLGLLGVSVMGGAFPIIIAAIAAAFLGTALGLWVSAFAATEFQAVQMVMPILMPQVLVCGLFVSRDQMAKLLQWFSDIMPLTYSVDAMQQVSKNQYWTHDLSKDLIIVASFAIAVIILGSISIKRQE